MSDIKGKRPRILGPRVAGLRLTPEERILMARIDGERSVSDLVRVTGLEAGRVEQIVSKLAFEGAVDFGEPKAPPALAAIAGLGAIDDGGTTSMAELAAALGMDPSAFAAPEAPPAPAPARPRPRVQLRRREPAAPIVPPPEREPAPELEEVHDLEPAPELEEVHDLEPAPELEEVHDLEPAPALESGLELGSSPDLEAVASLVERMPARRTSDPELPEMHVALDAAALEAFGEAPDESPAELEEVHETDAAPDDAASQDPAAPVDDEAAEVARAVAERNYREVYEKRWHELTVDQRVAGARVAKGADLLALCFDADPRVIGAILENAGCGLDHVRLIAFHHRTGTGLEVMARRQDWLRDLLVERRLLRNPMIGEVVLGRVMGPKRLFPTYKIAIDRDIPELSRIKCRGFIRQKWQTAPSEERADLVLRTEGRCLIIMSGCTFDAKTTAIMCGRPINSVMFVQSIAKFGSSPPSLLAHLMKQPFVRKSPPLKKMLLAHPNMPGDVKRSV
ncbi:MAG: hypothetical protein KF764_01130 [Labilithrix sp.]|nr:hypothetical protein [Labilithrix sp.]